MCSQAKHYIIGIFSVSTVPYWPGLDNPIEQETCTYHDWKQNPKLLLTLNFSFWQPAAYAQGLLLGVSDCREHVLQPLSAHNILWREEDRFAAAPQVPIFQLFVASVAAPKANLVDHIRENLLLQDYLREAHILPALGMRTAVAMENVYSHP